MTYLLQIQFQNEINQQKIILSNYETYLHLSNFEIFKSHKEVQKENISEVFIWKKSQNQINLKKLIIFKHIFLTINIFNIKN